jgi:hypothetical protein
MGRTCSKYGKYSDAPSSKQSPKFAWTKKNLMTLVAFGDPAFEMSNSSELLLQYLYVRLVTTSTLNKKISVRVVCNLVWLNPMKTEGR